MHTQHFWFLLLFFGLSMASWVINKLREQAKLKAARDEARRRYEESLRTGRPMETAAKPAPTPAARNQELVERRQAQLRELRKQQEGGRPSGTVVVARAPSAGGASGPTPLPVPGRVVIQRGGAQPGRPMPARPQPARPAPVPTEMEDPRIVLAKKRAAEQAERERLALVAERAEEEAVRAEHARFAGQQAGRGASRAAEPARRTSAARASLLGGESRPAALRRAVMLTEVFGPPVALRG